MHIFTPFNIYVAGCVLLYFLLLLACKYKDKDELNPDFIVGALVFSLLSWIGMVVIFFLLLDGEIGDNTEQ